MFRRAFLLSSLILFGGGVAHADAPDVIAVFDIEISGLKLKRGAIDGLNVYLFNKMAAVPGFKVVPRSEVKKRLVAAQKESYKACYDQSCQIEVGRELAAQKTLSTKILKLGAECNVSVVLYDLRTAATESAADATGACTAGALARTIEAAVGSLAKKGAAAAAPVAVPAMGVVDKEYCPEAGTRRMGDPPPKGQSVYCLNEQNQMHGKMISWHPSGKPSMQSEYRDGQLEGKQTIYHRNGQPVQEGMNRGNRRVGTWTTYYDDGVKMEEGAYENGVKSGVWIQYDRDGKKNRETGYAADAREGKYVEYLPDGSISHTGEYSDDKETGVWVDFRRDGTKSEERTYKAGRQHGPEIEYDSKGQKTQLTTYANGKRNGLYQAWRDSGGTRYKYEEGNYLENQKDGRWVRFKPDGSIQSEETWKDGKAITAS